MKGIELRIRHADDGENIAFGELEPGENPESAIATVKRWGVYCTAQGTVLNSASGQFVIPVDGAAHFEIVMEGDDD